MSEHQHPVNMHHLATVGAGLRRPAPRDLARTPLNVYWETTRACGLACRHCRAAAIVAPDPGELTGAEAGQLLEQVAEFGAPLPRLILTGGDPLLRRGLMALLERARELGIDVSITPAASPALTRERLQELQAAGVEALGLSLDGSSAGRHDALRGVPGTFDRTLAALQWGRELGLPMQVNSLVSAETAADLPALYRLLEPSGIARWSLFFLIPVGRGQQLQPLPPAAAEELMHWIYQLSLRAPFVVATTEAPSYRRVVLNEIKQTGGAGAAVSGHSAARGFSIRDGHGIVFVSNTGEIYPSGFLPLSAGNVRRDRLAHIYRSAPLFQSLHDPRHFHGRCGECEYHGLCGGSRARAFAATGDPLGSDPICTHGPRSAD